MKAISIITINLNNDGGLRKTVNSLMPLRESGVIEFIFQDGLSSDDSLFVANSFYRDKEIVSEPDCGIYDAMNKAILRSTGRYLLFLNSGDWLIAPEILLGAEPLNFNEDVICFGARIGDHGYFKAPAKIRFSTLWFKGICHQAMLLKRDLFITHGLYDYTLKIAADWEFFIRIFTRQYILYRPEEAILVYSDPDGISCTRFEESQRERKAIYMRDYQFFYDDYIELMGYRSSKIMNAAKRILDLTRAVRGIKL